MLKPVGEEIRTWIDRMGRIKSISREKILTDIGLPMTLSRRCQAVDGSAFSVWSTLRTDFVYLILFAIWGSL
jgi:hypothetical protein